LALGLGCGDHESVIDHPEETTAVKARRLTQEFILVDTHVDVPYRMQQGIEDISSETESGDFDFARAREGGLNAPFMSIYVPSSYESNGRARAFADELIDMVEGFEQKWPDKFRIARSVQDVRSQFSAGVISLPMGMENGAPIEGDLENLRHFYRRGIRYITLTHSKANHICDSSYDSNKRWGGLSPFGREVVAEMNRLGIMIDISHVSDEAFYDVAGLTTAPLIASHSSCRRFTPGWERNMDDAMIRRLAEGGGVIQINFGSAFISGEYQQEFEKARLAMEVHMARNGLSEVSEQARTFMDEYLKGHPLPAVDVEDVADHIDHVVSLVGIDHVGIGSDFDGVGDSLPNGLKDVSQYPNLVRVLLDRGYSAGEVEKICSGNLLRVWEEVERGGRVVDGAEGRLEDGENLKKPFTGKDPA